ncbi:hypothetical protein VNO77_24998 [Canavalia gladiata]|uniref:DUF1639 family protein n=1 Tax=Canavalia gladiata TaxID=3824 RepID=A0AAN9QGS5_CANGL
MATAPAPVKSQPLHNFALPFLKWGGSGKNHTNTNHHHRCRRPSVPHDHASEPESDPDSRPHRVGSRTARNRFGLPPCSHKQQQQQPHSCNDETDDEAGERKRDPEETAEAEETVQKPWNLRPRKPALAKAALEIGTGASRIHNNNSGEFHEAVQHNGENPAPKSLRLRGFAETQCTEKKEKRKFWIALSREEIEEDIFIMTGSRPARRPRKRPKNVQKQMDSVFPGLWLVGITADAYRVADTPTKR